MVRLMDCTASGALAAISAAMAVAGGHQLVAGRHLLHDAEPLGLRGVDAPAGEGQQLGLAGPDLVGQPEVAAGVDGHADLGLGQGEDGVVGRHPDVAHERELEAEAEAVALHGAHDRLGQLVEDPEALVHPADALVVVAHLLGRRAAGDPVLGHAEVDAGAEGPALGLDHEDPDAVVEADPVGQGAELARGLPGPHVELLGVVEREGADAASRPPAARGAAASRPRAAPARCESASAGCSSPVACEAGPGRICGPADEK